jgi:hypothetical protein
MSWKDIKANTWRFIAGIEDVNAFKTWTNRFVVAGKELITRYKAKQKVIKRGSLEDAQFGFLKMIAEESQERFERARDALAKNRNCKLTQKTFVTEANQFHANVRGLGQHLGNNLQVKEHAHLNFEESSSGTKKLTGTPMTKAAMAMSPGRLSKGIAVDPHGDFPTTLSRSVEWSRLSPNTQHSLVRHKREPIRNLALVPLWLADP